MSGMMAQLGPDDLLPGDATRLGNSLPLADRVVIGSESVELNDATRDAFAAILTGLSAGDHVAIVRLPEMLTTQEAADLLRISRPTMVKLLDEGVLPSERPGVHRRVARSVVVEYIGSRQARRKAGLDALAAIGSPDGPDELVSTR